jgi:hypothetical protein
MISNSATPRFGNLVVQTSALPQAYRQKMQEVLGDAGMLASHQAHHSHGAYALVVVVTKQVEKAVERLKAMMKTENKQAGPHIIDMFPSINALQENAEKPAKLLKNPVDAEQIAKRLKQLKNAINHLKTDLLARMDTLQASKPVSALKTKIE